MKKLISLLLLAAMLVSVTGCGIQSTTKTESKVESEETTSVVSQEEKVEETVESKEEKVELWSKSYFVDEFEQPTDEWFVYNTTKFLGKFSNSATTDSSLTADVVVDAKYVAIFLYEYARTNSVKNNMSSDEEYVIKVKSKDGTVYDMTGRIYADGGDRVIVDDAYTEQFKNLLKGDQNLSVYLETNKYTKSTYLFEVIPANFKDVY